MLLKYQFLDAAKIMCEIISGQIYRLEDGLHSTLGFPHTYSDPWRGVAFSNLLVIIGNPTTLLSLQLLPPERVITIITMLTDPACSINTLTPHNSEANKGRQGKIHPKLYFIIYKCLKYSLVVFETKTSAQPSIRHQFCFPLRCVTLCHRLEEWTTCVCHLIMYQKQRICDRHADSCWNPLRVGSTYCWSL